jgi:hypothetical protein
MNNDYKPTTKSNTMQEQYPKLRTLGLSDADLKRKRKMKRKKIVRKKPQFLTDAQKQSILDLFYRTILESGEDKIDNSTPYISQRLGIRLQTVNRIIDVHFKNKLK